MAAGCSGGDDNPSDSGPGAGGDIEGSSDTGLPDTGADDTGTVDATTPDSGDPGGSGDASGDTGAEVTDPLLPLRARGSYRVASEQVTWVDESRTVIPADSTEPIARSLPTTIWYPSDATTPGPLVVWAHGLGSTRSDNRNAVEILTSRGYVVVAPDFPRTNRTSNPPDVGDVVNQPGDLRYVADRVLERAADPEDPLHGKVSPDDMAYVGLSLGAMTVMLATWQEQFADPRIDAAVVLAPPACYLPRPAFETTPRPMLVLMGTGDAIVDYSSNYTLLADAPAPSVLVTLEQGSHTAFADVVADFFNNIPHPDVVGCSSVVENLDISSLGTLSESLGGPDAATVNAECTAPCSSDALETPAMRSRRQADITMSAVAGFLDKVFADPGHDYAGFADTLDSEPDISVRANLVR
jgi:dienelactone hydrolase